MQLSNIKDLVEDDFNKVDNLIESHLTSNLSLITQINKHIINSGGKRLRPLLVLLTSKACEYEGDSNILLAALIEFLHTATLLHDDVVDNSNLRRGKVTANQKWGNEAAVLVGDFLYSRAFELMVKVGNIEVMDILSKTSNIIAEGEVLQLINKNNPLISEENYLRVITSKTAALFKASAKIGAVISETTMQTKNAYSKYGLHIGIAFQLIDDLLDYESQEEIIGKNLGDDLADGKVTMPLIYLLKNGTNVQKEAIHQAIINGDKDAFTLIQSYVRESNALQYTLELADFHAKEAADSLLEISNKNIYWESLLELAKNSSSRSY